MEYIYVGVASFIAGAVLAFIFNHLITKKVAAEVAKIQAKV